MGQSANNIDIYTDGSCSTQYKTGAWAAIILIDEQETAIQGIEKHTTHQRMELLAVIQALKHVQHHYKHFNRVKVFTDSQYLVGLPSRKDRIISYNFVTKGGKAIRNADLIKVLYSLLDDLPVDFSKVKAHQKQGTVINYNRTVDKMVRRSLRDYLSKTD